MKKATLILTLIHVCIITQAIPLTLNNGDFEKGAKDPTLRRKNAIDNDPAEGWDVLYENEPGNFYALEIIEKGTGSGSISLNIKAYKNGNIIQQPIFPSEATADTYGTFKVTMDLGTRNNSGVPLYLKIIIWDITLEQPLASEEYRFPLESDGFIERKTFTLSYDNTNPNLKNHRIALRFVTNSKGHSKKYSYKTTHWIDNVAIDAVPSKTKLDSNSKKIFIPKTAKKSSTQKSHTHGWIAIFSGALLFFRRNKNTPK